MADGPKSYQGIMLSSTFTDLVEHRQKAKAAIDKLGFHTVGMESSGAQAADVITVSLDFVRHSAAYIGIITKKYGQTPEDPERNPDGRSITELEFDEAMRLGRPILLFIMADDHKVLEEDIELDPDRREKLKAFKARAKLIHSEGKVERVWETFGSVGDFAEKIGPAVGNLAVDLAIADYIARSGPLTVPEPAVRGAIARFIDIRPEATEAEIAQAVESFETGYRALQEQVAAIAIIDNRIAALKGAAEQALGEGHLDITRRLYKEAADAARERATEPVRATAQLLDAEARAHLLALDWEAADQAWTQAVTMLTPFDLAAGEHLDWDAANALYVHGDLFARGGALSATIRRWRALADAAENRADFAQAAKLRCNLGNALTTQGERAGGESGLALLTEAVAAYRAALTVHTEADMPSEWATVQNNLGNALQRKAERTGGGVGLALLAEAIAAYHAALIVRTEATMPVQWAMTQNNLGVALKTQGHRTGGEAGLALLAEAVAAHRAALVIHTESAMPADRAMTQNNLGNALQMLGELTGGEAELALLTEAVATFRAAFTVYTEAAMPADWAMTQNNLGTALGAQGERSGGEAGQALLVEAVAAFHAALTVYTEAAVPADWAMTQENLALTYETIADLGGDPPMNLGMAEAALCDALRIYTPEHMPYNHQTATNSLTRIRKKLAALAP